MRFLPILLLPFLSGCLTTLRTERSDFGAYLIEHPEFRAAAVAAPNWTEEALNEIARLERELYR
jgi:hypothetical protein